jgi:hypothetical protein
MSDPVPVIVDLRRIKPVKLSTLHAKAERYRDGFVKLFREYEHADVNNEDGSPMLDGRGRITVTASWFAREMGINKSTFHYWLNGRPEPEMGSHSERTDDEGWDLPGVPQDTVDKIREAVEHDEALLGDPNSMTPEPEDRRPFSAPDRIHIFRSWVTRMHADDLGDRGWKLLDEVQEQITRLYDELAESR